MSTSDQQAITGPKSPYGRVFIEILLDETLSQHAKLCYAVMTSFGPGITWASIPTIGKRMSVGEATARAAQRELEKAGWIVRGESVMGSTIHWRMLAPFERTIKGGGSLGKGARVAKGGGSRGEGEGLAQQGGVAHPANPKQELKHELKYEPNHDGGTSNPIPTVKKAPAGDKGQKKEQTTGRKISDLEQIPICRKFKIAYDACGIGTYDFNAADGSALTQALSHGLSDAQIDTAIAAFFSPTSWHRRNAHDRFANFAKHTQRYARSSFAGSIATKEDLARYYEPWDPRHPYFKPNDPIKLQQKSNWEAGNGPWKPKPEYTTEQS